MKDTQKKKLEKKAEKAYPCTCCDRPRLFLSAKARRNHKYFLTKKLEFKCPKCGDPLSTKQKLE